LVAQVIGTNEMKNKAKINTNKINESIKYIINKQTKTNKQITDQGTTRKTCWKCSAVGKSEIIY
jgi:hypothetical protein